MITNISTWILYLKKEKEGILNKFTIPEKCHIILLPGRITSWKGHRVAVEALNILLKKEQKLNTILIFVGSEHKKKIPLKI